MSAARRGPLPPQPPVPAAVRGRVAPRSPRGGRAMRRPGAALSASHRAGWALAAGARTGPQRSGAELGCGAVRCGSSAQSRLLAGRPPRVRPRKEDAAAASSWFSARCPAEGTVAAALWPLLQSGRPLPLLSVTEGAPERWWRFVPLACGRSDLAV